MSDAEVIQGRLGWESGDVSEAKPEELQPHPKNQEIYGDTESVDDLAENFVESVAEKGVLEPLVITSGKQIISGHRRLIAAKAADVETVPVRYCEFDDELAEREALIEFNRQREKTPPQIVNEFEEMLAIERQRGQDSQGDISTKNLVEDEGDAQTRAAKKINAEVSGETLRKGKKVKDKAGSDDESKEVREAAQEAWDGLNSGEESFNSAYEKVKQAEQAAEDSEATQREEDIETGDLDVLTSQQTDEWSSPREVVEPLDAALGGFDLDPCSGAEQSPFADATYTEDDDGLAQPWHGAVWVNPPYSEMWEWTDKAIEEMAVGNAERVVFLCKGDSSTDWWQAAAQNATLVTTIDHRLSFGDGANSAPFASHILLFGPTTDGLIETLTEFGTVLTPGWSTDE